MSSIPRFGGLRHAAPIERIAELSPEAQELFQEWSNPSTDEILPGLNWIPEGLEYLVFEFMGIPGIAACLKSRLFFIIDSFNERPPRTPQQARAWTKVIQKLPDSLVKLIALNVLESVCVNLDLNHRPFTIAFESAVGGDIERLNQSLGVPRVNDGK